MSAEARALDRPLPFVQAARGVFDLTLEGMLWSRRSLLMAVLLGLPVLFGLLYRVVLVAKLPPRVSGDELYGYIVAFYYVRNVLPLAALFYASALVADEVEARTLGYLLTRPLRRSAVLLGKFFAYLATTAAIALPSLVITFFLLSTARGLEGLSGKVVDLFRDSGVTLLALAAYGALFTCLGVLLRRPAIPGLLFLFGWELLANLPGYLPRLTITAYLRSLISHRPAEEGLAALFGQTLPMALSLGVLAGIVAALLALAAWIFSSREYVIDH